MKYSFFIFWVLKKSFTTAAYSPQGSRASRLIRNTTLAFGPQHPAAHGILKIVLQLQGEVLRHVDPQFGYLHRGTEKLMENRNFLQSLPYFDRFDYVANFTQEHAFCSALEALQPGFSVPAPVLLARSLFDELSRVLNHLLTLSATALDLSAMGPIFWAFEERENVMALLEQVSGARMHTNLYRPFSFDFSSLTATFYRDLVNFLTRCARSLNGAFLGLLNNRSLKSRLSYVGQLSPQRLLNYGISGIIARSAGLLLDRRFTNQLQYGAYGLITNRSFLGRRGDNLDRFLIRVKETIEVFRILSQLVSLLFNQDTRIHATASLPIQLLSRRIWRRFLVSSFCCNFVVKPALAVTLTKQFSAVTLSKDGDNSRAKFTSMEALITHFRTMSEGYVSKAGWAYQSVESPKGEVGVTLIVANSSKPARAKLRTPVSHNMHLIPAIGRGALFADFVATFCSLDIVLGEIDR